LTDDGTLKELVEDEINENDEIQSEFDDDTISSIDPEAYK
jgi:hypothetical protein